jgi:hypothetical protein
MAIMSFCAEEIIDRAIEIEKKAKEFYREAEAATGLHFGFPFCHGGDIADPQFGRQRSCDEFTPPVLKLGAHVAALGMKFYTGSTFPPEYRNRIFIAEYGSWNRTKKAGYRIMEVDLSSEPPVYSVFAEGWMQNETAWGRPVDILVTDDGALLVSDDMAGAVYRIEYTHATNTGSVLKNRSGRHSGYSRSAKNHNGMKFIDLTGKLVTSENWSVPVYLIDPTSGKGSLSLSRQTN